MERDETPRVNGHEVAVVFLHSGCNMNCGFCVTDDAVASMTFEQAVAVQDYILAERSIRNLVLGGGEPFTWPHDVVALARKAKEAGFFVQVGTNGVALPEDFERIDSIDRYVLPLESMDPAVHDAMRPYRGSHQAVVMGRLARLRHAGISTTVSTVVTAENIGGLGGIAAFLQDYCAAGGALHAWHLYRFIPEGRGGRPNAGRYGVTAAAYHEATNRVREMDAGFTILKRPDMYHSRSVDFFWYQQGRICAGSEVWAKQG
ncbi:MAG: radical SAM protein [Candidatus Hydrogenedentes bacterium]|nr:radical SAM protein [Candidatus Hydrogenedentota bacterium]